MIRSPRQERILRRLLLMGEQNAAMALSIADRGHVLATGEIVPSGLASEWRCRARI